MSYYVYILCSQKNGTLYIGVTNNLARRVYEHKNHLIVGFTQRYDTTRLVYVEEYASVKEALHREKCLKRWNRTWKLQLIEEQNPEWRDLYEEDFSPGSPLSRG